MIQCPPEIKVMIHKRKKRPQAKLKNNFQPNYKTGQLTGKAEESLDLGEDGESDEGQQDEDQDDDSDDGAAGRG